MFFKAVLTSEGLAKALIPEVDPIQAAEPYIKEFLRERFGEDRLKQDAFYNFLTLSSLGRRLPVVLSQAFDDYEHNRMQLLTRDPDLDRRLARQDAMVNRAVTAILTVAAFGAGTAFLARSVYTWIDIGFGVLFYLAGAGLFVVTATLTLRSLTHDAGGRG
jgi:ubiquinone biosynthesis protein